MPPGRSSAIPQRGCIKHGLAAGAVGGIFGGMPSTLALSAADLDLSIRSIAHLVPGNQRFQSAWSRRALGAATHMSISATFAVLYGCVIRKHLSKPSLAAAAGYGAVLWAVNYRLLGPKAMRAEDRSFALADHLCWAEVVEITLRTLDSRGRSAD